MLWKVTMLQRSLLTRWRRTEAYVEPIGLIGRDGQLLPVKPHPHHISPDASWPERRTALLGLLAEGMVRAGAMTSCYRAWVMPVGSRDDRATVLIRLYAPLTISAEPQEEVEAFLAHQAPRQIGVDIHDVVWLRDKHSLRRAQTNTQTSDTVDYWLEEEPPLPRCA